MLMLINRKKSVEILPGVVIMLILIQRYFSRKRYEILCHRTVDMADRTVMFHVKQCCKILALNLLSVA